MPKPEKSYPWKSAHTLNRLCYHVVFVPKYRRQVLQKDVVGRLEYLFIECAKINQWFIHELEILPDHIHMMIQLPTHTSIAKAVQYLKGGTSRVIRKEYPKLKEWLWGDSLWQDGYFAETIGRIDEKAMREYIQAQWEQ